MKHYFNTPSKLNMKLKQYTNDNSFFHDYQIKNFYNNMQSSIPLLEKKLFSLKYRTNKLSHYPVYKIYYQNLLSFRKNTNTRFEKCKSCNYFKKQIGEKNSKIKELTSLLNKKQPNVVNNICIQNVHNDSKNEYINNGFKTLSKELKSELNKNSQNLKYNNNDINDSNENMPISLEDMMKITKKKSDRTKK